MRMNIKLEIIPERRGEMIQDAAKKEDNISKKETS